MYNPVQILLTKFVCCDSDGTEKSTTWGYTLDDDFESCFYDGYESVAEAADAISPKNVLCTVAKRHPHFLAGIEREGGLLLENLWVNIADLRAESENENW